jgi:glycosyltransferase involved in cell wall biosynthesis
MNILFFNSCRDAGLYGVERWMLNLGGALRQQGHWVGVAAQPACAMLRVAQASGLAALPLGMAGAWDLPAVWQLRTLLRCHAVQTCCVYTFAELRLAALARCGLPVRLLMRRGSLGDVRNRQGDRWTLRLSGADIVTGSQALKADFCSVGWLAPQLVHVLPHGLDLAAYVSVKPATGLPPARVRVAYAGRLDPLKGTDVLLEAWRQVQLVEPGVRLLLVGDGAGGRYAGRAAQLGIAAGCDFVGYAEDLKPWLAAADIFVLPSLQEGASYALLQAQATGLPVVATRVGGNPELTHENETALLVPPANPEALAAALLELIRQPERRRQMGAAARVFMAEHFSLAVAVRTFLEAAGAASTKGFPSPGK